MNQLKLDLSPAPANSTNLLRNIFCLQFSSLFLLAGKRMKPINLDAMSRWRASRYRLRAQLIMVCFDAWRQALLPRLTDDLLETQLCWQTLLCFRICCEEVNQVKVAINRWESGELSFGQNFDTVLKTVNCRTMKTFAQFRQSLVLSVFLYLHFWLS